MPPLRHQMRRRPLAGTARFLTFSCYRRLPLFNNDKIKDAFADALTLAAGRHGISVLAWVVMPEHVHLVVYADDPERVSTFLRSLKRPFATAVLARWRTLSAAILTRLRTSTGKTHFWQLGGGYDRNVIDRELIEKIRYIHVNPIHRGLSDTPCRLALVQRRRISTAARGDRAADRLRLGSEPQGRAHLIHRHRATTPLWVPRLGIPSLAKTAARYADSRFGAPNLALSQLSENCFG